MCLVAFGCAIFATVMYIFADISAVIYTLYLPMEVMAWGLRKLSLSSTVGDVLAWVIYIGMCLVPVGFIIQKKFRMRRQGKICNKENLKSEHEKSNSMDLEMIESEQEKLNVIDLEIGNNENRIKETIDYHLKITDVILIALSAYLFFMMYCFINPGVILDMLPNINGANISDILPMYKTILAGVAYSLIIGYVILKLVDTFKTTDIWIQTERILIVCTLAYVGFVCFVLPLNLFEQFGKVTSPDEGIFFSLAKFFLDLLPMACFVGIMEAGVTLIHVLKENKYSERAINTAKLLAERSRRTVIVSVVCNITQNVIQLMFYRQLLHVNFLFDIPFLPLILAFTGLLIAEHLKESSLIYDDNSMII